MREGFSVGSAIVGSALDYSMGNGVKGSWENKVQYVPPSQSLESNTQALSLPLKNNQLDIFANNRHAPECCPATYSGSTGCVCATPEQMSYLNQRGGNRTLNSMY